MLDRAMYIALELKAKAFGYCVEYMNHFKTLPEKPDGELPISQVWSTIFKRAENTFTMSAKQKFQSIVNSL